PGGRERAAHPGHAGRRVGAGRPGLVRGPRGGRRPGQGPARAARGQAPAGAGLRRRSHRAGRAAGGGEPMTIWYERAGEGEPVVLLPSSAADAGMWDGQWEARAGRFQVIRVDYRGYGRTPYQADGPYSDSGDVAG